MTAIPIGRRSDLGATYRREAAPSRHVDVTLAGAVLLLALLGVVMVFSATRGDVDSNVDRFFLIRQSLFAIVGFGVMVVVSAIDYRRLRPLVPIGYVAMIAILIAVLTPLGSESKGAQAWFQVGDFQVQPSEFAKLGLILTLSGYLSFRRQDLALRHLLVAGAMAAIPMGLILLQPDVGTVAVFVGITLFLLLVGGAQVRHIVFFTVLGIISVVGILNSDVLESYQRDRLTTFVDPDAASEEVRYNVEQSQTAIASGGFSGRGLFDGPLTQSGSVPEQPTDFIFTVVGEELGFLGALTVLGLYGIVIWRIWRGASLARDTFGSLICVGVMAMFLIQVFQSVGMAEGIMPVTGIPLPLLSYGGSSMITSFIAVGLVESVHMNRFR